ESQHKELEKAYAELKAAQSQILQQEKMASIGQLAAGIAHEINNPVGFVMSNLGSLQKYADKLSEFIKAQTEAIGELGVKSSEFGEIQKKVDEFKKSLKIDYIIDDLGNLIRESLDGAERVKKIVQDLKSFSRIDEAEWKMADINAGIESTINMVWNELKYKATVKKEYGDIPLTKCNPGQLNQVFMNMLINAAHAIEKQGEITVKTWHGSGFIYILISDTGKGIPSENLNRIFEPFFTTKEVGKGTGLGLSIAYDIVKKHNGDITVESKAGKGSAFTIKIPVVER
ncbi:MAG: ATP-binding protein, partial [Nitrospiraceae bacterium]|nr:ATP-binding protein [Nitrospiraceae bacterium]